MLSILIDYYAVQVSWGRGIGRYGFDLIEELLRNNNLDINLVYVPNEKELILPPHISENHVYTINQVLEQDLHFDCFIIINFFITESAWWQAITLNCTCVAGIIYDFIPYIMSNKYLSDSQNKNKYDLQLKSTYFADLLFCISDSTKNDGIRFLVRPEKIFTTIYGGIDEKFLKNTTPYTFATRNPVLVYIGGDDYRKNCDNAVRAFGMALDSGKIPQNSKFYIICRSSESFSTHLIAVGKEYNLKKNENLFVTGYVSDETMIELVSHAIGSIFPSLYEGLGLPILESYALGTPCIGSWNSSMKELIQHSYSFDGENLQDMADKIVKIFTEEELNKQNLVFGKEILAKINWKNTGNAIERSLQEYLSSKRKRDSRITVFTTLPPDQSGIALFNALLFSSKPSLFDVYGNYKDVTQYQQYGCSVSSNFYPCTSFPFVSRHSTCKAKIFVLGNSPHHIVALQGLLGTKGERNRYLYIHEYDIRGALLSYQENGLPIPDCFSEVLHMTEKNALQKVIEETGVNNIMVNNKRCEFFVKKIGIPINVFTLFLPIIKYQNIQHESKGQKTVIGTFGNPNQQKGTALVIQAMQILVKRNPNMELVVSGFGAKNFCKQYPKRSFPFISVYEQSDSDFENTMNMIDLAIQLRIEEHGESSGCISQLIGMGKKVIVTKDFMSKDLEDYCFPVPKQVDPYELSIIIEQTLKAQPKLNDQIVGELCKKYSFEKLADRIGEIVDETATLQ